MKFIDLTGLSAAITKIKTWVTEQIDNNRISVDSWVSDTSTNPVQNKVITSRVKSVETNVTNHTAHITSLESDMTVAKKDIETLKGTNVISGKAVTHETSDTALVSGSTDGLYLIDLASDGTKTAVCTVSDGVYTQEPVAASVGDLYYVYDGTLFTAGADSWIEAKGSKGNDAEVYKLTTGEESVKVIKDGTYKKVSYTLQYTVTKIVGDTITHPDISSTLFWRYKIGNGSWVSVQTQKIITGTYLYSKDTKIYIELLNNNVTVDSKVLYPNISTEVVFDIDEELGTLQASTSTLSDTVDTQGTNITTLTNSQATLKSDLSSAKTTLSSSISEVSNSVTDITKDGGTIDQKAAATLELIAQKNEDGSYTSKMNLTAAQVNAVANQITLSADSIDLTGYTTINDNFQIDDFGNYRVGVEASPAEGSTIVEKYNNIVFTGSNKNLNVYLPNDPEYIGKRILVAAMPSYNSAGSLTSSGTVHIYTGRTFVNHIYFNSSGGCFENLDEYDNIPSTSNVYPTKSFFKTNGLIYFGNTIDSDNETAKVEISLQNSMVELLGIPYTISNTGYADNFVTGGTLYKPAIARQQPIDGQAKGEIEITTEDGGYGLKNGSIMNSTTYASDTDLTNLPDSIKLCFWVVVNQNNI